MKAYIKTHGCTNNYYESEVIMGLLEKNGFKLVKAPDDSDYIIVNICTVKGIETAIRTIRGFKESFPDKRLVITGCISKDIIPEIRKIDEDAPLVNTHNITRIVEVIEELNEGNTLEAFTREKEDKLDVPKVKLNDIIGIVPIATGCVDHCAYCSVKLIKGHIYSYPKKLIISQVKKNLKEGCKEIWITSQDNGAYGLDRGNYELIDLMEDILNIRGDFKVRLGMLNPHHALNMLDGLIDIYQDEKMFKFIHLPVEAGNNEVLSDMKRKYNIFEFKEMVHKLRRHIEGLTLATDIIVGFPTESELQFHDSLNLVQDVKPEVLNISRFHPRPNTKASKMKQIESWRIKERSREVTRLYFSVMEEENKKWLGWEGEVLIDAKGKNNSFIARNGSYKQVILKGNLSIGQKARVRITYTTVHDLRGVLIKD